MPVYFIYFNIVQGAVIQEVALNLRVGVKPWKCDTCDTCICIWNGMVGFN